MLEKKTISQFPNTVPNAQRASTRASHFVDDRWIANELSMKASTIRVQRHRLIHDLITSPAFIVIKAADEFRDCLTSAPMEQISGIA